MRDQDVVDKMEAVRRSIDALCATLTDTEWQTPTPGSTSKICDAHFGVPVISRGLSRPMR
jgi:hypothetical protein